MNTFKGLLKNATVYSLSNILNALIPFLLLPILTRVLAPSEYGVLAMFSATLGVIGAFTGLSVNGAVNVRFIDRNRIDFPRYIGSCISILLISTLFTLCTVCLFRFQISQFTSIPPLWLIMAVLVSMGNFLVQIRLGIWLMSQKPLLYGAFQVLLSLSNMGLSLIFVLLLKQGYEGRLLGQALAVFAFSAIGITSLSWNGWLRFPPRWIYVKEALSFGVPLVPHVIGGFLIVLADRFIINQQIGLIAAGVYMVAAQIGMGMGLFTDAVNKAFVPWLYEHLSAGDQAARRLIIKGTWLYFGVILIIACIVASLSHWIVRFIAGPTYIEAANALVWLSFGQAFFGMYLMVTNYVFYKRKTNVLPWITLSAGFVGVSLTWLLTPIFGIAGAGFSFASAMCLRFLMTWFLAQKVCPMPWFNFSIRESH